VSRSSADIAREIAGAFASRQLVPPPSTSTPEFDLTAAYAVENELARMRRDAGHSAVGVKVGYASKAVWRALKLDTLVWGRMYDDTVHDAAGGRASISIAGMIAPKIEPEVVFRMKQGIGDPASPEAVLAAVESIALGFEVIDCPFPDWKFQPVDFVAAYGLHAALVVGDPLRLERVSDLHGLAEELAAFKLRLYKDDRLVAEGSGRNSLRSPALCLGELASAMAARRAAPLAAGDLVSSGTLTESQVLAANETWRAEVDGIALQPVTLKT